MRPKFKMMFAEDAQPVEKLEFLKELPFDKSEVFLKSWMGDEQ